MLNPKSKTQKENLNIKFKKKIVKPKIKNPKRKFKNKNVKPKIKNVKFKRKHNKEKIQRFPIVPIGNYYPPSVFFRIRVGTRDTLFFLTSLNIGYTVRVHILRKTFF